MEIDLVANHKHTKEKLYVECKAKEKVSSDELSKFAFNVEFKEADKGYFFRTQELESQAGALLEEIRAKPKYKTLTFFEPSDIIEMLIDAKMISEAFNEFKDFIISKKILAVTYFGDYFIYLINDSNALPTRFVVIDAKNNSKVVSKENIDTLKNRIVEIKDLTAIDKPKGLSTQSSNKLVREIESISEVQESENWYDYLPASSIKKHFVGRDEIRTKILDFFTRVSKNNTQKRIFYLNGKSGWGKSSLVLELNGRCRNKYYRNRFYSIAIDTRSANSDNFVALSFKKLINKSISDGFISKDIFFQEVSFTSNTDLLSSDSVNLLLNKLQNEKKYLVLIFDQFEDVFRKKDFFKTFYKFLSDVTDMKPNIIVGFSWKTDFLVQSGDPSYHIWQQAKEQAIEFTIDEFGEKEIYGLIKQLENSVGSINQSLKNRIIESSQGLPWLTKKLAIHIHDQIINGILKEDLIESNLNIEELFKKDEENVEPEEYQALKLIAKRAYDSNFFDESEIGDLIESKTISSLLNKRLIIRSGANYNIYWDIYRDYLVTDEIPTIGESYLLRQGVNLCLEVFLLFDSGKKETIESLLLKHSKPIGQETLNNILIELRNIGIVQKEDESYFITKNIEASKDGFIRYITNKFENYTPYISIKKLNLTKIAKSDVIQVLKSIFKQDFQDNTWDAYAKNLINWFILSEVDIKSKLVIPQKGRGNNIQKLTKADYDKYIPRSSLMEILEIIPILIIDETLINNKYHRDLLFLNLIDEERNLTQFGLSFRLIKASEWEKTLKQKILEKSKMKKLQEIVQQEPKITAKELIRKVDPDFFSGEKESSKIIYANKAISWFK